MAIINVDDAYILNETGAQVDKVTGLFTKNENATTDEKQMARLNIAAGGSNRNLFDNWYFVGGGSQLGDGVFPINQRGQTSYSGAGVTTFDRWICDYNITATLQSGGVRVQTSALYSGLSQIIPAYKMKDGETYTVSIIVDGTLHSATFTAHDDGSWYNVLYGNDWYMPYQFINGNWYFKALNASNVDAFDHLVSAVKIEKGTISTLANDVPPDFGEELRKCQRYLFIRDYATNQVICNGVSNNLTLFLPASMRSGGNPQLTLTATPYVIGYGIVSTPTSVTLSGLSGNQVQIYAPTNESHANTAISLYAPTSTRLTISNEL